MLIDSFLPEYDFSETHDIKIRATAKDVFRTLNEVDLCESPIIRLLLFLRGISPGKTTLHETQFPLEMLGENENRELLLGLTGRFWTLTGGLRKIGADKFREFNEKGLAKAAWNFSLDEQGDGETRLTTETRIRCTDAESRRSFRFYWTFVQPFSGLIRMEILKTIKRKAEGADFNRD